MSIKDIINKKIAIIGLGVENRALLGYLVKHGAMNITICDKNDSIKNVVSDYDFAFGRPIQPTPSGTGTSQNHNHSLHIDKVRFKTGEKYLDGLDKFNIVFRTPGLPVNTPEIQKAKKAGTAISSQMKLFFDLCPAKIIGVTGTKGKGTTCTLISEILKYNLKSQKLNLKNKVWLAGNIGNAPIEILDDIKKDDKVILELSSFQLQDMDVSPHIAVVLNITSDHLDYHKDTSEYIEAKTNIVRHQKHDDFAVINMDYDTSYTFAAMSATDDDYYFSTKKSVDLGTYIEWTQDPKSRWGKIILRTDKKDIQIIKTYDIQIRGEHNLENICAAITASHLAGASIESIKNVLEHFKGLQYRIELVWEENAVKYYNDSASTNPDTTIAAIKSFNEPIVLIAGGSSKGANYSKMGEELAKSSVKTLILMGVTADRIEKSIKDQGVRIKDNNIKIIRVNNLQEAIGRAKEEASSGDVVLFSPASASFDMFRDYKDRGAQFDKIVRPTNYR